MSPLMQSILISGTIFVFVMASQYGRRAYKAKDLARPLFMCAGIGYFYLRNAPTDTVDYLVYGAGALVGAIFGLIAYRATKVEQDANGSVWTTCRTGFVSIWVAAVVVRIVFISLAEHNQIFRAHLGEFMFTHQIVEAAIPPFFVLMALAMVLVRIALIANRVNELPPVTTEAKVLATV